MGLSLFISERNLAFYSNLNLVLHVKAIVANLITATTLVKELKVVH